MEVEHRVLSAAYLTVFLLRHNEPSPAPALQIRRGDERGRARKGTREKGAAKERNGTVANNCC